ncbi:Alpha/Beta hydrolase protein [Roridomyces roridus]|uniref:Alpha/Beta hydrolase protein n=1 Tax=Roridomyces roridus TaxID=1738132 RepID=A0AAD7CBP4_9AGAR|nr:Alpha/Beta hydrolase protein [Roridomyces roridus]
METFDGTRRWGLATLLPLPAVLLWTALTASRASGKSLKRILGVRAFRYLTSNLSVSQVQYLLGNTMDVYTKWTKSVKLPRVADELGGAARLLWVGPKRLDRVIYVFHGGYFILPVTDFTLAFWRYVQVSLEKQGIEVGIAVLQYSLAPISTFPTPLNQARLGLEALLAAGVRPENLIIAGDSAGGNLALQLFSQMLHPLSDMPEIRPASPFRGLCLLSPWVSLTADTASVRECDGIDTMTERMLAVLGADILAGFPEADHAAFAEASKAPGTWFHGLRGLVQRVLVTAGSFECMRDDITRLGEGLKTHHPNVELVVQEGGLHDDMLLDFMMKESKLGSLTPLIISWIAAESS